MPQATLRVVIGLGLVVAMLRVPGSAADGAEPSSDHAVAADPQTPPVVEGKTLAPPTQDWRNDPACQLVFFAVLEGLYTDGVPDEVVDLIVPPPAKDEKDENASVKRCFVFRCPLCHAAYEAFVLYQRRQAFNGSDEKNSTFGTAFDRKILDRLKSDEPQTRVYAMGEMIRPWIERRMRLMNLGADEQKALLDKLLGYAADGNRIFGEYRQQHWSVYSEWMFYGGCQACEAAQVVAREMRNPGEVKRD